jgi:hypothetical protein
VHFLQFVHSLHSVYLDTAIVVAIVGCFTAAVLDDRKALRRNRYKNEGFGN